MPRLDFNQIPQITLAAISIGILAGLGVLALRQFGTQHLILAAGSRTGESYILSSALKRVVERHNPAIRITVLETGGTAENLKMIESGKVQLATSQADVMPGPLARCVAILYDDEFQLLVPNDSPARKFGDLRGRRIALPQTGGQFHSFLSVAEHFGLQKQDFSFVGATESEANQALLSGKADATFRVRTVGDPSLQCLIQTGRFRFVPVEQAAAMRIKHPEFQPAVIPEGAYLGNPAVPANDLPTVALHRLLVARATVRKEVVLAVTEALVERRQEVMSEIPPQMTDVRTLLAQVRRPEPQAGFGPPVHSGAQSFYDREKPSFIEAHADYVGLLLTILVLVGSWIWELKQWMQRRQKQAADWYSGRVVTLIGYAQQATSLASLADIWNELLFILNEAVCALDKDTLSEESFASFKSILQVAMDVAKERRAFLLSSQPEPAPAR